VRPVSEADTARVIASACGALGSCRDYLFNTIHSLEGFEIHDHHLNRIAHLVSADSTNHPQHHSGPAGCTKDGRGGDGERHRVRPGDCSAFRRGRGRPAAARQVVERLHRTSRVPSRGPLGVTDRGWSAGGILRHPLTPAAWFLRDPAMRTRRTMNVSITPELEQLVADTVASGRYGSASEVVRAALRLFEEQERRSARNRPCVQPGS
jgi:putative addiction module CopG family antidote